MEKKEVYPVAVVIDKTSISDNVEESLMSNILIQSAANNNIDVLKKIVELGVDVNMANENTGSFALESACLHGNTETVEFLLKNGANPNQVNRKKGYAVVVAAIVSQNCEKLRILLEHGADTHGNSGGELEGTSNIPLSSSALMGRMDFVDLLIQYGPEETRTIETIHILLNYAASAGQANAVAELLKRGGDPFSKLMWHGLNALERCKERRTLPDYANRQNDFDITIRILLFAMKLCFLCEKNADKNCSKCRKARYCSKVCQISDWHLHKNMCN